MPESRGLMVNRDDAEKMAIAVLAFLASRPDDLGRFLALTGIGPRDLRRAAAEPGFLAGVMDFLAGSETLLVAFAADQNVPAERVAAARRTLAAGA